MRQWHFLSDSGRAQTCNLLIRSQMLYSIELRSQFKAYGLFSVGLLFCTSEALLLDTSLLTGQVAEIEDSCPSYLTCLVKGYLLDERRIQREYPLNSNTVGYLSYCKCLGCTSTTPLQANSLEVLQSFLVTLFDLVGNGYGITCLECRELFFLTGKSLLSYFD